MNLPAEQLVQVDNPAPVLIVPGGQLIHVDTLAFTEKDPALHKKHTVLPDELVNIPIGQDTQAVALNEVENCPGEHGLQADSLQLSWKNPGSQALQVLVVET